MTQTLVKNVDQLGRQPTDESNRESAVCAIFFASIKELYGKYVMEEAKLEINISCRYRRAITAIFAEDQADMASSGGHREYTVEMIASALACFEDAVEQCVSLMTQSAIRYSAHRQEPPTVEVVSRAQPVIRYSGHRQEPPSPDMGSRTQPASSSPETSCVA